MRRFGLELTGKTDKGEGIAVNEKKIRWDLRSEPGPPTEGEREGNPSHGERSWVIPGEEERGGRLWP